MVLNACTAVTLQLYVGIEITFVWLFYMFLWDFALQLH
jgi:hypothetical protein